MRRLCSILRDCIAILTHHIIKAWYLASVSYVLSDIMCVTVMTMILVRVHLGPWISLGEQWFLLIHSSPQKHLNLADPVVRRMWRSSYFQLCKMRSVLKFTPITFYALFYVIATCFRWLQQIILQQSEKRPVNKNSSH